jgi:hypothetical protein
LHDPRSINPKFLEVRAVALYNRPSAGFCADTHTPFAKRINQQLHKGLIAGWAGSMAIYELAIFDPSDPIFNPM